MLRLGIYSLLLVLPLKTLADDPLHQPWGASGDWEIFVDTTVGNGCFMQKDFEDGLRVRFGFHPIKNGGFFSALNREWTHIEPGKTGLLKFFMDNEKFAGDAEVVEEGQWKGGYAFFNNPNLVVEFARRKTLIMVTPSGDEHSISLSGTFRAIDRLEECQAKQGGANE